MVARIKSRTNGSPPRVWGIRISLAGSTGVTRFTPTRVGNTSACCCSLLPLSVHPHACGEYATSTAKKRMTGGSPPRVWGIRQFTRRIWVSPRFTPTRVGNTTPMTRQSLINAVHPHACGEYQVLEGQLADLCGSPPRVWGIHDLGKFLCRMTTVHPHACGEYWRAPGSTYCANGSPPRVWVIPCRSCAV